jgi:MYXO-CTERM domain-containing protein
VIGVTSRGGQNCSSPVYGYVEAWADWIKSTAVHAAEVGGYTAPAWATGWPTDPELNYVPGDACLMPTDCASNRCVTNGTDQYCTRLCTDAAPCPDGFLCQPDANGENVCTLPPPPPPYPVETANDSGSCRVSVDPTKPVPWRASVFALALVALGLRRRKA